MSNRVILIAGLVAIVASACTADSKDPEPTLTATSQPAATAGTPGTVASPPISLTPKAGVQPDIARARALEGDGNIEEAVDVYVALAAQPATRSDGTLGAARLMLELDRPTEVRALLEPFVTNVSGQDVAARYMLARAYTALNMPAEALQQYDLYIQSGRPALPYAQLDRARNLLSLNRAQEAATSAQTGLSAGLPGSQRTPFRSMIAQSYERAGQLTQALAAYQELIDADGAFALAHIAEIKRGLGDPTAADDVLRLLGSYPSSSTALDEMTKAMNRGETIPPVIVGLVYYRQNEYTKAQPRFEEQIATRPNDRTTAEAYYYLAAIQESKDQIDAALANYALATSTNPDSTIADDALWWRGRIAQDQGRDADAQALFARIVNEYPNSSWAIDAAFRRGFIDYVNEDYADAADTWQQSALSETDATEKSRLQFWQGKALLDDGSKATGEAILTTLAAAGEDDYYGIRAGNLLKGDTGQPEMQRESNINLSPTFDWAAAETWLAQKTGRVVGEGAWATDQRWLRAQELWLVGRNSQGDGEVFDLMESYASDPVAMYTMSRRLQSLGRTGMAGRAGQRLLRTLSTNPNQGLPKPILSLAYPPAFGNVATKYSNDEKISPLLLLAFVRQESFFDPRAESPVGALGLTQLLPNTGSSVASKLGVSGFDASQLLHADLNLKIGANYMATQLKDFDNEIFVALAAYNAGPSAAQRWRDADGTSDADVYLETVEFAETRLYIEIVAENYAIYRYLYGGEARPTLP
ncbi:MAG: transglycosylase SLT domain-containing protein [Dehalococcoidia bacterium]